MGDTWTLVGLGGKETVCEMFKNKVTWEIEKRVGKIYYKLSPDSKTVVGYLCIV